MTPSVAPVAATAGTTKAGQSPDTFLVQLSGSADTFRKEAKDAGLGFTERFAYKKLFKGMDLSDADVELRRVEAIICSMTPQERRNIHILNASRRKRIATGSGTSVADVNRLLKQFTQTKKMMKKLGSGPGMMAGLPGLQR